MPNIVGATLRAFLGPLLNPASAGTDTESLSVAVIKITSDLAYIHSAVADFFDELLNFGAGAEKAWQVVGADFKQGAQATSDAIEHILSTIIPGSLAALRSEMNTHLITPIGQELAHTIAVLNGVETRVSALEDWRKKSVDPDLKDWERFYAFWQTWPNDTVATVHDWLQHPGHFADLWADVLVKPVIGDLDSGQHEDVLQPLTSDIIDHMAFNFRHVESMLVGVLTADQSE